MDKAACSDNEQCVKANLELSPQRRPLAKAQAMFFKGLKEVGGNEANAKAVCGKLQVSSFAEVLWPRTLRTARKIWM